MGLLVNASASNSFKYRFPLFSILSDLVAATSLEAADRALTIDGPSSYDPSYRKPVSFEELWNTNDLLILVELFNGIHWRVDEGVCNQSLDH